ncbi:TnsA endonuclease N-terminal domain-containing protein [Robertmurraya massiliosenegalensis]|uniref:TnsA endonuclease N-terminal domain-containing protein n=1 Tax=Robertmurraya massiliosenegalensis TaxID=1287657 RepID=UPI0003635055|nr:TnsA endonuclease N-terminal domain-containing protein [Robertmurraya massiliosenegalensis]
MGDNMRQARKIKPSKKGNYRGYINSRKCDELVEWESLLEKDFIKVLDFDPSVNRIQSQPLKIKYRYKGKLYKYFPDFLVETKDKHKILFEVKPENKMNDDKNKVKFEVGKIYCETKGWDFIVVTEKDIRKGFLIQNLDKIRKIDERLTKQSTKMKIYGFVQDIGKCNISDVRKQFANILTNAEFEANLYFMIYNHYFEVELINEIFSENTIIHVVR